MAHMEMDAMEMNAAMAVPTSALAIAAIDPSKAAVTTRGYTQFRHGANDQESELTALAIQARGIKVLFDCVMEGDARGSEGQPLVVPNVTMLDGMVHDLLIACTMGNDIYCFDATTPDPRTGRGRVLWKQHIGNPVPNQRVFDMFLINDQWGVLSTPVIDLATMTLYCTSLHTPDGTLNSASYFFHTIDLVTGAPKATPIDLDTASYQPPDGLPLIEHGKLPRKQRSALVLDKRNGHTTVFVADSTFAMMDRQAHGFVIAIDVTDVDMPEIAACWTATARYAGAGVWMGGGAMCVDEEGHLYAFTANGAFDGKTDFGNSMIKLQYTPKSDTAEASLKIVDWWCPYTDCGRMGGDPTTPWLGLINKDIGAWKDGQDMTYPGDQDLGSAPPILLPKSMTGFSIEVCMGAGKDGVLYATNTMRMGKTQLDDFRPSKIAGNWRDLVIEPYGLTYYPGDANLMPDHLVDLHTTAGGYTHHMHASPVFFPSYDHGLMLFAGGENGPVRAFQVTEPAPGKLDIQYLAAGAEVASPGLKPPGGMPGWECSLSHQRGARDTAVLWAIMPWADSNMRVGPGRLVCYGAEWIEPGGVLKKIWDSADWGVTFSMNKFDVVTVANGRAYLPTYDAMIRVFGLAG